VSLSLEAVSVCVCAMSASQMKFPRYGKPTISRNKRPKSFMETRGRGGWAGRTGVTGFRGSCSWAAPDRGRAPPRRSPLWDYPANRPLWAEWSAAIKVPEGRNRCASSQTLIVANALYIPVADMVCAISWNCLLTFCTSRLARSLNDDQGPRRDGDEGTRYHGSIRCRSDVACGAVSAL
jgi:hypothetical protein